MSYFYVIRHGQTDWNAQSRLQGQRDIPLNDIGRAQARKNGQTLLRLLKQPQDFDFVASPLIRASETMGLIRGELGLPKNSFHRDERLKEVSFGDWEGHTRRQLLREVPELLARREADGWNFCPPNGESYAMMSNRISAWLENVQKDTVMVAHGGVLRILQILITNAPRQRAPELPAPQDQVMQIIKNRIEWI